MKSLWLFPVALTIACGEVSKETPDAAPDAPPDAPALPVKVRVLNSNGDGTVDQGAVVIFRDASTAVVKQGVVNQQGEAEAMVAAGGMVQTLQVSQTSATSRRVVIMSFHDVKPGDLLRGGLARSLPSQAGANSIMTGSFTAQAGYSHSFWTTCGSVTSAGPTVDVTLREGCRRNVVEVLAVATSTAATPTQPRFVFTSAPYANGGAFTVPNTWLPMANFTATLTHVPDEISAFTLERSTQLHRGDAASIAIQRSASIDPPAGTVVASVPYPQGAGEGSLVTANLTKAGVQFSQRIDVLTGGVGSSVGIDLDELKVPWVATVTFNAAERSVSWTETTEGTPDIRIAVATFSYVRDGITYSIVAYDFAAPSANLSMVVPPLPTEYAEFDPSQQTVAVSGGTAIVGYADQDNLDGFDAARGYGIAMLSLLSTNDVFANDNVRRRSVIALARAGVAP